MSAPFRARDRIRSTALSFVPSSLGRTVLARRRTSIPSVDRRNPLLLGMNDMLSESEGGLDRLVARGESPTWAAHRAFASVVPYVRLSHLVTDDAVLARDAGHFRPIQPPQQ